MKKTALCIALMLSAIIPICAMDDDNDIELGQVHSTRSISAASDATDDYSDDCSHNSLSGDNAEQDFIRPENLGRYAPLDGSYDRENNPIFQLIGQMIENNRLTTLEAHKLRLAHEKVVHEFKRSNASNAKIGNAIKKSVQRVARNHSQIAHMATQRNKILCSQAYVQPCVTGVGMFGLFLMLWGNGDGVNNALDHNTNTISNALYQLKPECHCNCPACPTLEFPTPAPTSTMSYDNSTSSNSTHYFNTTYNPALSMNTTQFMAMVTNMTNND